MSIEGSINVSALFHDKDGTTAMKVVSLRSSTEYPGGLVAAITGTAGTALTTIQIDNVYRDATGELVQFPTPDRIVFLWNGISNRRLQNVDGSSAIDMLLLARRDQAVVSNCPVVLNLSLLQGGSTGTYTIVVYGTE